MRIYGLPIASAGWIAIAIAVASALIYLLGVAFIAVSDGIAANSEIDDPVARNIGWLAWAVVFHAIISRGNK
jgi:hypothetical protein